MHFNYIAFHLVVNYLHARTHDTHDDVRISTTAHSRRTFAIFSICDWQNIHRSYTFHQIMSIKLNWFDELQVN